MGRFKITAANVPDWASNAWVLRAACLDDTRNTISSMSSFIWRSAQGTYATDGHRLHLDEAAVHDGLEGMSIRWLLHGDNVIPPECETNGAQQLSALLQSLPAPEERGTLKTSAVSEAIRSMLDEAAARNAEARAAVPPSAGRLNTPKRVRYQFAIRIKGVAFEARYLEDACHGVEEVAWRLAGTLDPIVIEAPHRLAIVMPRRHEEAMSGWLVRDLDASASEAETPPAKRPRKARGAASRKVAAAVSAAADAAMLAPAPLPPAPEPIAYRLCDRHGGGPITTAADMNAVMDAIRAAWTAGEPAWAMAPDGTYLEGLKSTGFWGTKEQILRDLDDKPAPSKSGPYYVHVGPKSSEWRTFGAANAFAMTRARQLGTGQATVTTADARIAARYVARDHRVTSDSSAVGDSYAA